MIRIIFNNLRILIINIIDYYRMVFYYGWAGDFFNALKELRIYLSKRDYGFSHKSGVRINKAYGTTQFDSNLSNYLKSKLQASKSFYDINTDLFDTPPTILFISSTLPRFNETSADYRLFNILKILLANYCKIEYVYRVKNHRHLRYASAFEGQISFTHLPFNQHDYCTLIAQINPDLVWITSLWSIYYMDFMTELVEKLGTHRYSIIVDTLDFHYKEFLRKYSITKDQKDLTMANDFLKYEKQLYRIVDTVIVVSDQEKNDIQNQIRGIKSLQIVPNIHETLDFLRPYRERKNICFVGHFGNKHNVDAVLWFTQKVFQFILKKNPYTEFHVLGYLSENFRKEFKSQNVKVIGSIKNLKKALSHYRLFVCPLSYGAGVKGKIGSAVEAGVPVVTTSIGAEGFPLTDGEECFISDSPKDFAEKCNQCLDDPVLWHHFSAKSRLLFAENYSPRVVTEKLRNVLSD